jgi:hypothetical protein
MNSGKNGHNSEGLFTPLRGLYSSVDGPVMKTTFEYRHASGNDMNPPWISFGKP